MTEAVDVSAGPRGERFVHEALVYRRVEEFLAGTSAFVGTALEAGEAVLVAVPEPRLSLLREELGPAA